MQEVDREAFEGVSVWHSPPHGVLELLVAAGNSGAPLHLIRRQSRGQQVAEMVVPHCSQIQVLEQTRRLEILHHTGSPLGICIHIDQFTFLCSYTR